MEMEYVPCWGRVLARRWHRDPHPDRAYFILFPLQMIRSYPFRDFKTANSRYFSQFTMESFSLYFHRIILFSFLQLLPFLHVFVLFLFFPSYSLFHNLKNSQLKEWGELLLDFYWKHQMTSPPSPLLGVASEHCAPALLWSCGCSGTDQVSREIWARIGRDTWYQAEAQSQRGSNSIWWLLSRFHNLFLFQWGIKQSLSNISAKQNCGETSVFWLKMKIHFLSVRIQSGT